MIVKKLLDLPTIVAGDHSLLKEIINPKVKGVDIRYSLAHAIVSPGNSTLPHRLKSSETYYIISGTGEVCINNQKQYVSENDLVYIPPRAQQSIRNTGNSDLVFLCICDPAWRKEDEMIDKE